MKRAIERLKSWARALKRDVAALWIAAGDPRTPLRAKWVAGAVAAYALSPIDLIPDFIPVLGYLDDLVIVPVGIALAIRLIPPALMAEFRVRAMDLAERPRSYVAATLVVVAWLISGAILAHWLWPRVLAYEHRPGGG
jgi:uncharacterized membrane protein YkvA (DUF1232 family)